MVAENILFEAARRIVEEFRPRRIILFGSQARGTSDSRSDVDLLVILDDVPDVKSVTLAIDRSLWDLPMARDVVVMTPQQFERDRHIPGTIARPAFKEGRVLYDLVG